MIALLFCGGAQAQDRVAEEVGMPFPNEHFPAEEYGQHPQNWDIAQDDRGVIYVANNDGVLEYDGAQWGTIEAKTDAAVRSLAADSVVYVGGVGNFGVLRPDTTGSLRYVSLSDSLSDKRRDFEDVWNTHVAGDGVYFQANKRLFRWDGDKLKSWETENDFHTSFSVRGRLFVREIRGRGLLEMRGDSLREVPAGDAFAETPIYMMAPYPDDQILIGTQNKGLLLYDGETLEEFAPDLTPYLQAENFYHGTALPDGRYALGTLGGGVVLLGEDGNADQVLDDELPGTVVNRLHAGGDGTLWMALHNNGVFQANVGNAVSVYEGENGVGGLITSIDHHEGRLLVTSEEGAGLSELRAQKRPDMPVSEWRFSDRAEISIGRATLSTSQGALLAAQEGIYRQSPDGEWEAMVEGGNNIVLGAGASEGEPVAFAGRTDGIMLLEPTEQGWKGRKIEGVSDEVRSIHEETPGTLWISTNQGAVFRLSLSEDRRRVLSKKRARAKSEFSDGLAFLREIGGEVLTVTSEGAFRVSGETRDAIYLERISDFLPAEARSSTLHTLEKGPGGTLWLAAGPAVYRGRTTETGEQDWQSIEALRFPKPNRVRIFAEENGVVWIGSGKRLFRYDSQARSVSPPSFESLAPLVRQVTALGSERTLYGGAPGAPADSVLSVPYTANNIRVRAAMPFFAGTGGFQYQFRLRGRDGGWTDWRGEPTMSYTKLQKGTHRLQARVRTAAGTVSRPASFTLYVIPPWYQTLWAYLLYWAIGGAIAFGAYRLYQLRRARQKARLRARELERERLAKERLEEANDRLREANRLKEEFLANMSHELRTPLTNILGFTDLLRENASEETAMHLELVEKNGQRLLDTFNALLDLANLRSGDSDLDLEPVNVSQQVQQAASGIRPEADEKGLDLSVDVPDRPAYAMLDADHLNQILSKLLDNAVKFTDEGYITASVEHNEEYVDLRVTDTGIGIDDSSVPEIFDDFRQESRGMSREYEGNGLGLSIAKRLVDLMDGEISVESTKGEGSTFTVRFPRADDEVTQEVDGETPRKEEPVPVT